MYSTCIHCHAPLGTNELVAPCPVGRRLAFDARHGRLWIVCARCREWNLTPLEERWEAIEDCERLFRSTRLRASTENIGLAKLPEGLELVRIGTPLRPEIAAWRYGAEFRRRRLVARLPAAAPLVPMVALNVLGVAQIIPISFAAVGATLGFGSIVYIVRSRWRPRVVCEDGRVTRLRVREYKETRLERRGDSWGLRWQPDGTSPGLEGKPAERALRSILAGANSHGGYDADIRGALGLLDQIGGGDRFLTRLARVWPADVHCGIWSLPPDVRLALEMAVHEETERRALEGELATLEDEWRLAEEVASIADNLFLPDDVAASLRAAPGEAST